MIWSFTVWNHTWKPALQGLKQAEEIPGIEKHPGLQDTQLSPCASAASLLINCWHAWKSLSGSGLVKEGRPGVFPECCRQCCHDQLASTSYCLKKRFRFHSSKFWYDTVDSLGYYRYCGLVISSRVSEMPQQGKREMEGRVPALIHFNLKGISIISVHHFTTQTICAYRPEAQKTFWHVCYLVNYRYLLKVGFHQIDF